MNKESFSEKSESNLIAQLKLQSQEKGKLLKGCIVQIDQSFIQVRQHFEAPPVELKGNLAGTNYQQQPMKLVTMNRRYKRSNRGFKS